MDEYEQQLKLRAVGKFHRYHFLKKALQLVVSVALLSFFLCHSSGFSLFPHSFNVYFSTLLFSFFTHSLERKYMFLICNGILAFLDKSSVSSSSSLSESDVSAQINLTQTKASVTDEVDGDYDHVPLVAEGEEPEDTYKNVVEDQGEQENKFVGREEEEEEEERESEVSAIVEDGKEYKGESGCLLKQEEQEVGAEVGANEEVPSTEELNRKFEDFIRKMKEKIKIEAQQQLIGV
ncbi:hypothetical protein CRYUN_Cryun32bG0011500 [Craigia yunnanensis]